MPHSVTQLPVAQPPAIRSPAIRSPDAPRPDDLSFSAEHFRAFLVGARSCGLDLAPVLAGVGLDWPALAAPGARVAYSVLSEVRLEICRQLDDESAGFLDQPARWGSTVYFCRALVSSRTLREALYRYERFQAILNGEVRVRVVERADHVAVEFDYVNRKGLDLRAEAENRIFFLLSFALWLTDRRFAPRHIGFAFPRPPWAEDYRRVVQCDYLFDQTVHSLALDDHLLREPVRRSPRLLNQFLADHLSYLVTEMVAINSVSHRIRSLIAVGVGVNTDLDAAAALLRMSATTLRRRLKSEGATFQELKDEVRLQRAVHYLVERRLSVAETAELVGYSDAAAFSRAFKTWTGASPSEFGRAGAP